MSSQQDEVSLAKTLTNVDALALARRVRGRGALSAETFTALQQLLDCLVASCPTLSKAKGHVAFPKARFVIK
ncbi:hypothetical protein [Auritidibacter ignavus]|uniref:hypothetical protein n=1 Tax=Auritidibacter ignavus TaxID=678932 RepID=UPI0024BBDA2C|nr:hypothetical protein [Auritidibacter ignavus]WHS29255.1 hypothetical protein QM395_05965 [Auritidibacter ignavus]